MGQAIHYKEAVGVFDNQHNLDKAVAELESSAFGRHNISVLGSKVRMEKRFGADAISPQYLENNPRVPKDASIRPEEKTIASGVIVGVPAYVAGCAAGIMVNPASGLVLLAAVTVGSLIGAGIGAAALFGIKAHLDRRTQKQIDQGGLLLWVKTFEPEQERVARDIMMTNGAKDVHIHQMGKS